MLADVIIDPLKIYQRLKAAKLDEEAAKEIATIFGDVLETQIATKKDIAEIQKSIEILRHETKQEIALLQSETKKDIALTQKDMNEMEKRLELKIEESKTEMLKWAIGLIVTQTGIILAFFKLLK